MGLYDWIFGSSQPQHPSSRGAMLGARYQDMPTSQHIEDIRKAPEDYAANMRDIYGGYARDEYGDPVPNPYLDPKVAQDPATLRGLQPANMTTPTLAFANSDTGAYSPSFKQGWRPRPSGQAPYRSSPYGPNLPAPPAYDPAWLQGITPGMQGWQTPPSSSGPHPRTYPAGQGPQPPIFEDQGGGPIGASSSFSPLNVSDAVNYWRGGTQ